MNSLFNYVRENHMLATIENVKLKRSFTLNLSNFEIENLPQCMFTFEHDLLKLFLQHNNIKKLPVDILQFHNLHTLTLDYNNLTCLPSPLYSLKNLINLNISYNPLNVLTHEIAGLTRLEVLWCNNIGLEYLPKEIGELKNLDTFGARGNRIVEIPLEFTNLVNLRWVTLENNLISELPAEFRQLQRLIHLNMKQNLFDKLPSFLGKITSLQFCFFGKNHISSIQASDLNQMFHLKMLELKENPITTTCSLSAFPFVCLRSNWSPAETDADVLADSSEEDWEHSLPSTEIDSTEQSEGEFEDNEALVIMLPDVSRFAAIC